MDSDATQPQHHHLQPPPHQQPYLMMNTNNSSAPASTQPPNSTSNPDPSRFPSNGSVSADQHKKKRGRPRKYSADAGATTNNIPLGLSPTSATPGSDPVSEPGSKRSRGRPAGSGKKQLDALGAIGVGFTPHVITVKAGEDIASKITAFAQQGPRAVCILSANGAICNVTLRQPAMSTGSVTHEGRFEIISLSGSFLQSENYRNGSLSVSIAGSDGRVLGGNVVGILMAASPTQVIVGSFISDAKKPKTKIPSAPSTNILNFGAPVTDASPPSQGASSDSSDEGSDSPLNHGPGPYNLGQPMQQSMSMYPNMSWSNSTITTHPN